MATSPHHAEPWVPIRVDTTADVHRLLARLYDAHGVVALDTETAHGDMSRSLYCNGDLVVWSVAWREGDAVFGSMLRIDHVPLCAAWLRSDRSKVGHNIRGYDDHIFANMGIRLGGIAMDTLRASRMLYASTDPNQKHGLKALMSEHLGWAPSPEFRQLFVRRGGVPEHLGDVRRTLRKTPQAPTAFARGDQTPTPRVPTLIGGESTRVHWGTKVPIDISGPLDAVMSAKLTEYAIKDAVATLLLAEKFTAAMASIPTPLGSLLDVYNAHWAPALEVLSAMERRGVACDVDHLARARSTCEGAMATERAVADDWCPGVNWASGKQVAELVYDRKGYKVPAVCGTRRAVKMVRAGKRPVDQVALEQLINSAKSDEDAAGLRALADLRELTQLHKYLIGLPEYVRHGRIRAQFAPDTETGRLACRNPALQQIPKGDTFDIRGAFVAKPGHVLVGADMSQLELRILAHLLVKRFDDRRLAEDLDAADVHSLAAKRAWASRLSGIAAADIKNHPDPSIRKLREWAKAVIYGMNYGKGPRGMAIQLGVTAAVAKNLIDSIKGAYGVDKYQEWIQAFAMHHGYVPTLFGRRRTLPGALAGPGATQSMALRQALNTPIQGSAADLMMVAMTRADAVVPNSLVLQVHDELVFEVPEAEADNAAARVKAAMESVSEFLLVPIVANVGVGSNWSKCK